LQLLVAGLFCFVWEKYGKQTWTILDCPGPVAKSHAFQWLIFAILRGITGARQEPLKALGCERKVVDAQRAHTPKVKRQSSCDRRTIPKKAAR
jgi:hypothetical protein